MTTARKALGNVTAAVNSSSNVQEALGNVAAAVNSGNNPSKTEENAVSIQALPGSIVHSNNVQPEALQQHFMTSPALNGIAAEQAAAITEMALKFFQMQAQTVPEPTLKTTTTMTGTPQAPATAAASSVQTNVQNNNGIDEDRMRDDESTDDDEEDEVQALNTKEGDTKPVKPRINKSVKAARNGRKTVRTITKT